MFTADHAVVGVFVGAGVQDSGSLWNHHAEQEGAHVQPLSCLKESNSAGADGQGSEAGEPVQVKVPKLLKTYLAIGARIAAQPAWDRGFGTIDFLTLLDLKLLSSAARSRFLAPLTQ